MPDVTGFVPKHVPLLEYKIRLDGRRYALMIVPEDLSDSEAARLGRVLSSVAGAYPKEAEQDDPSIPATNL